MAKRNYTLFFSTDKNADKSGCGCRKYTENLGLVPRAGWCKERWRNDRNRQQWVADLVYSSTPKLWRTSLLSSFNIHYVSGAGSIPTTMNLLGTLKAFSKTASLKSQNKIKSV